MDYYSKNNPNNKINSYLKNNPSNNSSKFTLSQNQFGTGNKSFSSDVEFVSKALGAGGDVLLISNNLIQNDDWDSISNHLTKSQVIHTVELSGVNISGYGLRCLADALQRANSVKNLKLEWNYLNEYSDDFDYFCDIVGNVNSLVYVFNVLNCRFT